MPLSLYALDKFVSQEISKFTEFNLKDAKNLFSQSNHWLANFILNSIFRSNVNNKAKHFIFVFLRRSEMAFIQYEYGRKEIKTFLKNRTENVSHYFRGLYYIESTISLLYQAYEAFMKFSNENLFTEKDGSPIQRLNRLNNIIKHIEYSSIPEENLHPIWLNNKGVLCNEIILKWDELYNLLEDVGKFADKLSSLAFIKEQEKIK